MNVPVNRKYTKDHEWLRLESNVAYVGITDYAQEELGDIVFIEIETVGERLDKGEVFGTIEAVKTVSDLFLPVGGEVLEINPKLEDTPEVVNKDPYNEGWMVKIKVQDVAEVENLMNAEQYIAMLEA